MSKKDRVWRNREGWIRLLVVGMIIVWMVIFPLDISGEFEKCTETDIYAMISSENVSTSSSDSESDSGVQPYVRSDGSIVYDLDPVTFPASDSETNSETNSDTDSGTNSDVDSASDSGTNSEVGTVTESTPPEITFSQLSNAIYNSDVTVTVTVTDPTTSGIYSGVALVTYEVYNMGSLTQSGTIYRNANTDSAQGTPTQSISGAITVLSSKNNSNEVEIIVYATDLCDNSSKASVTCQIDTTAPSIEVSYDNNSPDAEYNTYFSEGRTASITISERNFDADDVVVSITNTEGTIPVLSEWTKQAGSGNGDNTAWTASVECSADGDYTFAIAYTDEAGNKANAVTYAVGTVAGDAFTIDRTNPVVAVTYQNTNVINNYYYQGSQAATVTITERNFDSARVQLIVTENGVSNSVSPSWTSEGDVHMAIVSFENDAWYTFSVSCKDMAGSYSVENGTYSFYVDVAGPEIAVSGVENESANTESVTPIIEVTDTNYDRNGVEIVLEGQRYGNIYTCRAADITDGQSFAFENIEVDDIYELMIAATDLAGNMTTETIRFSVNHSGSTYEMETAKLVSEQYYWQYANMEDLMITEINPNRLLDIIIILYKNTQTIVLSENEDYKVEEVISEGGWHEYTYTIYREVFEADGIYNIRISSVDEAGNTSSNILDTDDEYGTKELQFVIDNTKPTIVMANLENNQIEYAGIYQVLMSVSDNLALDRVEVYINGLLLKSYSQEEVEEILEENGVFEFNIEESHSAQTVLVQAWDTTGNQAEVICTNVLIITDAWGRFGSNMPLLAGTVVGIAGLVGGMLFFILYVRKRRCVF